VRPLNLDFNLAGDTVTRSKTGFLFLLAVLYPHRMAALLLRSPQCGGPASTEWIAMEVGEHDFMGEERGPLEGGGPVGSGAADEFVPVAAPLGSVSERSKPASKERMKTSHFEERIALRVVQTAQRRDESTQRELAAFNNDFGSAWLVPPAHCA
jgi:hypothetical protein